MRSGGVANVTPLLGRAVPKAMVNASTDPNKLVIYALPPIRRALIAQIIKQFDSEHVPDSHSEFYDVQKVDADAALRLAQAILQKPGGGTNGTATLIPGTHQLYVEARPEVQELIRSGLMRLKTTADTEFEAFQLDTVDAMAADSMIRRMFAGLKTTTPPVVEADTTSQKLYVRGTKEQITRIRALLGKMGETGIGAAGSGTPRRVRVIPFSGDTAAAMAEIQRVWPRLRPNELRVLPSGSPNGNSPSSPDLPPLKETPSKENPPSPDNDQDNQDEPTLEAALVAVDEILIASNDEDRGAEIKQQLAPVKKVAQNPKESTPSTTDPDVLPEEQADTTAPPIIVLPKDGNITIFSEDTEALDQLDRRLLRGMDKAADRNRRTRIWCLRSQEFRRHDCRRNDSPGTANSVIRRRQSKFRSDRGGGRPLECDRRACQSDRSGRD